MKSREELKLMIQSHPLWNENKKIVVARGISHAPIMFIGEAPGKEENEQGLPFVGRSGQLLNQILDNTLERRKLTYIITNIVPLIPLDSENKIRKPTIQEIKDFSFFLEHMIEFHDPKILVVMGDTALKGVLGEKEEIGEWVYKKKMMKIQGKERELIVTYHPAYYLRNGLQGDFVKQFEMLWVKYSIPEISQKREIVSEETFQAMKEYLISQKILSFDVEIEEDEGEISFHRLSLSDMSFATAERSFYLPRELIVPHISDLHEIFLSAQEIIAHNAKFDLLVCEKAGMDILYKYQGKIFDTMIAYHLINENSVKDLKSLSKNILGEEMTKFKDIREKRGTDKWVDYSFKDSEQTYKLYLCLKQKLIEEQVEEVFDREMRALPSVAAMTYEGITVDKKTLQEKLIQVKSLINSTEKTISKFYPTHSGLFGDVLDPIDLKSSKQLSNLLYNHLKIPPIEEEMGKSGYYKTGDEVLEKITRRDGEKVHEMIKLLRKLRKLIKTQDAFLSPLEKHLNGGLTIHPFVNQVGTKTGRTSVMNPNMQQLTLGGEVPVRDLFIARNSEWKILVFDYSQMEMRIAAVISKENKLIEAFEKRLDLHLQVAAEIFHLPISVEDMNKESPNYPDIKKKYDKERYFAKFVDFGILYGISEVGMAELVNTSKDSAKMMIENFLNSYPRLRDQMNEIRRTVRKYKQVRNMYGRVRRFPELDHKAERQGINFMVQGSGADMIKEVMGKLWKELLTKERNNLKLLMIVHDELVFEVKKSESQRLIPEIRRIMEDFNLSVKMEVEYGLGDNYGKAK